MHRLRPALTTLLLGALSACASTDATGDYRRAAEEIQARTGSAAVYLPSADEGEIEARVAKVLAAGPSVEDCVRIALLENQGLREEFAALGIARAEVARAGLPANPGLAVSARLPAGGGRTNLTVSLSQALLDLLRLPRRRRIAEEELTARREELVQHAVRLSTEVRVAAYRTLALRQGRALLARHRDLTARSVELAQHRLDAGLGDAVDVDLARNDALDAEARALALEGDLATARLELRHLLGVGRSPVPWTLDDELPVLHALPSEEELLEAARARRLDLAAARAEVRAAAERFALERRRAFPELELGLETERSEVPPSLTGPTITTTLPVFDRNQPGIARARLELARREHALEGLFEATTASVRAAREAAANRRALVQLHRDRGMPQARTAIESASHAYEAGRRDLLVLLEAQRRLLAEEEAANDSLVRYAEALARLESAVGGRLGTDEP